MVPWWAWVKRFHLPQAELINGRAASARPGRSTLEAAAVAAWRALAELTRWRRDLWRSRRLRFPLPSSAVIGYATGYFVDLLTHNGLVSQTDNFFGKTFMLLTFIGCAFVRNTKDLEGYKGLINEATFYDKQWNATWEGVDRPSEKAK